PWPHTIDGRAADQPDRNDLVFTAGTHFLNGKQALQLARLRPSGTLERTKAQNQVLCGLYDKMISPSIVGNIPALINAFENSVQTDLSPAQLSQLSCLGTKINANNIIFLNWPDEIFTGKRINDPILGSTFILDANFDAIRDYVRVFLLGEWPAPAPQASTATPSDTPRTFCE
ncbi:MAG: LCP family protein, partial [Anaerolineales bacterium]|nr:LCP family protein [Anaerolineales bacterium]